MATACPPFSPLWIEIGSINDQEVDLLKTITKVITAGACWSLHDWRPSKRLVAYYLVSNFRL